MTTVSQRQLNELRPLLRAVLRGLWRRRRSAGDLRDLIPGDPPLSPRHVAVLAYVGTEGPRTVGDIARELGLSLPAASKLARELEDHVLVRRSEDPDDRRRTMVDLNALTSKRVQEWLSRRNRPFERTLGGLDAGEREAFLKGLRLLGEALMEESACGPVRSHDRAPHRRRHHRHRPV